MRADGILFKATTSGFWGARFSLVSKQTGMSRQTMISVTGTNGSPLSFGGWLNEQWSKRSSPGLHHTLRILAADAIQEARSGHPGLPLGAASMAYVLWTKFLRYNPANPCWSNRDRFVHSAGHGSALLYSL